MKRGMEMQVCKRNENVHKQPNKITEANVCRAYYMNKSGKRSLEDLCRFYYTRNNITWKTKAALER